MKENVQIMISEEELDQRIRALGEQISSDYAGRSVHIIGVLKGACFFMPAGTKADFPEVQEGGAACRARTMISRS